MRCPGTGMYCGNEGYGNYAGYCQKHWLTLTDRQRAMLLGKPVTPNQETNVVTYHLPATPGSIRRFIFGAIGGMVGSFIGVCLALYVIEHYWGFLEHWHLLP